MCLYGESSDPSVLFYLRGAGFYVAVSFVGYDDVAVWGDLAAGHLKGSGDRAVLEQAFSGAERDRDYHELHLIDEIIFEKRLKQICASRRQTDPAFRSRHQR